MSGLKFPKCKDKKKRQAHKDSILQRPDRRCYLCVWLDGDIREHEELHVHHIYGGPNRKISEAEGFKVWLCPYHHQHGASAVHKNIWTNRMLQQAAQKKYEETHSRDEFMRLIGRNYLDD